MPAHDGVGRRAARDRDRALFVRPARQPRRRGAAVDCDRGLARIADCRARRGRRAAARRQTRAARAAHDAAGPAHLAAAPRRCVPRIRLAARRRRPAAQLRHSRRGRVDGSRDDPSHTTRSGLDGGGDRDVSRPERRALGRVVLRARRHAGSGHPAGSLLLAHPRPPGDRPRRGRLVGGAARETALERARRLRHQRRRGAVAADVPRAADRRLSHHGPFPPDGRIDVRVRRPRRVSRRHRPAHARRVCGKRRRARVGRSVHAGRPRRERRASRGTLRGALSVDRHRRALRAARRRRRRLRVRPVVRRPRSRLRERGSRGSAPRWSASHQAICCW